jgi:hypothetical protein
MSNLFYFLTSPSSTLETGGEVRSGLLSVASGYSTPVEVGSSGLLSVALGYSTHVEVGSSGLLSVASGYSTHVEVGISHASVHKTKSKLV